MTAINDNLVDGTQIVVFTATAPDHSSDSANLSVTDNDDDPPPPGEVVAGFGDDFSAGSPVGGWSYWWNEGAAVGVSSGYVPLIWNGVAYDSDGTAGGPSADQFAYGVIGSWGVHPGRGTPQGAGNDRYAIVRYTVQTAGDYAIVDSLVADRGCSGSGVELQVRLNDTLRSTQVQTGTTPGSFDQTLGPLNAGDTIDIAIGPDHRDICDATDLDFTIERAV